MQMLFFTAGAGTPETGAKPESSCCSNGPEDPFEKTSGTDTPAEFYSTRPWQETRHGAIDS